jgi:hypothetical protein
MTKPSEKDADAVPTSTGLPSSDDWPEVEKWLESDTPTGHDFLDRHAVERRLKAMLDQGTQSIGIVGPFGAGKTTIVKRMVGLASAAAGKETPTLLISEHSCWGFESSASSVHAMLADGIAKVEREIDTFHVRSLPESYRRTFSVGSELVYSVSNLLFQVRDPIQQFARLSALLGEIRARLVFVVEDLDRNESRSFDIQEVLAFLQQLKGFPNLAFLLTGGLNAPARIDFAKLCDHIEYLRLVSVEQAGALVSVVRKRCFRQDVFPHVYLVNPESNQWEPRQWLLLSDFDSIRPPEAIARLLNTPRRLRHALARTYHAWKVLYGEIDWDSLLAINVLRFAAPEAFSFVIAHWHRLKEGPSDASRKYGQLEEVRATLRREWDAACSRAEWDPRSARALIDLLFPAAPTWFDDDDRGERPRTQGLQGERYWQRVLKGDIAPDEVRDQHVIRDMRQWNESPCEKSPLVTSLCSSSAYSDVWEDLACAYLARDSKKILLLSEQVLTHIREEHGAAASVDSEGFLAVWRYATHHVEQVQGNREWLEQRITEAAAVSLELVKDLSSFWGTWRDSILPAEERDALRVHVIHVLRERLTDAEALERVVHPAHATVFHGLVFDTGDHVATHTGPESWGWLGPVLLDGLRHGNPTVAIGVCCLVAKGKGRRPGAPSVADPTLLEAFFGDSSSEVIANVERLLPQVRKEDEAFVKDIVQSAKAA